MKRPDMVAIFAPVKASTKEIAGKVLALITEGLHGYLATYYYARVEHDPQRDRYDFVDQTLQLPDADELFRRIDRDKNAMWCMVAGLGFAPAEMYPAVFADVRKPEETTLILTVDPQITRWVETEQETRGPFVLFLARLAKNIGSAWFIAGPHIETWRPLDITAPLDYAALGAPYAVGWQAEFPAEAKLIADLKIQKETIALTTLKTLKYKFADFFP
jgi:hypothetical protein